MADIGVVYYREIGKPLKIVTSPVLRRIRKEQRLKSRNVFTQSGMEEYWCQFVGNEKTDKVKSLFATALDFVAENAECIESLIGIPEIIGEQLFSRYLSLSFAKRLIPTCDTLRTFADVYGENVLSCLQLSNNSLVINDFLHLFLQFLPCLRELDVSKCLLGDNHEVIEQIRELKCLEYLNIGENALSDKTLRRLTVGYPERKLGLKYLDLSGNRKITNGGLEKLACFEKLEILNISGLNADIDTISRKLNMETTTDNTTHSVLTKGWSAPLVMGLIKAATNHDKLPKDEGIIRFYGNRPKICLNLFNEVNPLTETIVLVRKPVETLKRKALAVKTKPKRPKIDDELDLISFYR